FGHRFTRRVAHAPSAGGVGTEPAQVLHMNGAVEAKLVLQQGDIVSSDIRIVQVDGEGASGDLLEDAENNDRDTGHEGDRTKQPPHDILAHRASLLALSGNSSLPPEVGFSLCRGRRPLNAP